MKHEKQWYVCDCCGKKSGLVEYSRMPPGWLFYQLAKDVPVSTGHICDTCNDPFTQWCRLFIKPPEPEDEE